ncbi:glycosyltransferase [Paremcibacter congregatus]|uniref:Glycosyltransferase n=1 Tax=Paremcibacter congregatus TaxID=2043170 RepID=A0A2G4YRE7_9PROT|nr:glycosyltransferase [Paremcibacter congregatus]PHZ84840.1 hypothetical protein CRD36_08920 [Paremcibacter congregatus]QDE26187.1 glycosyltransferase [Paremcibacter congregatus]
MNKQEKYILQYGSLAGWPYKIAKGLRKKGVASKNIILHDRDVHDLNRKLPYDEALCDVNSGKFHKFKTIVDFIEKATTECSLIHYHSSNIFYRELHWLYEGRKFTRAEIPMLLSFGGGDARPLKIANNKNRFFYKEPNIVKDFIISARYFSWSKNIKYAATDPEMTDYAMPYFEKIFPFRQPVDLTEITCNVPAKENDYPIFLHIPTEPKVKGTEEIVAAVKQLKEDGFHFEFRLKRQLTQQEVYNEIQHCDVYIDELKCGSHGVTAVETMASGKPTITYIREDLVDKFPKELPIVNANPETIYDVMRGLIMSHSMRHEIGLASRSYVEKYHDLLVVCDDLIGIYNEIS